MCARAKEREREKALFPNPSLHISYIYIYTAHARLMFRHIVLPQDAIMAVLITESSLMASGLFSLPSALHSRFPPDPDELYKRQEKLILQKLGIDSEDIPEEEREYDYLTHVDRLERDARTAVPFSQSHIVTVPLSQAHNGGGGGGDMLIDEGEREREREEREREKEKEKEREREREKEKRERKKLK